VLAQFVVGKVDLADVLFLIAFILCCVVFVLRYIAKAVDSALMAAAVGLISLAFFVL
jgi:beta-lactamase regulating signal transducer with metallopeptidase domain